MRGRFSGGKLVSKQLQCGKRGCFSKYVADCLSAKQVGLCDQPAAVGNLAMILITERAPEALRVDDAGEVVRFVDRWRATEVGCYTFAPESAEQFRCRPA